MKLLANSKQHETADSLNRWLELATKGLCDPATQRIRKEVSQHYFDMIEMSLQSGCDFELSRQKALHELGNPLVAWKQFSAIHFSRRELNYLEEQDNSLEFSLTFFCGTVSIIPILSLSLLGEKHFTYLMALSTTACCLSLFWSCISVIFNLVNHFRSRVALVFLKGRMSMGFSIISIVLYNWAISKPISFETLIFTIYELILAIYFAQLPFSILAKLRRSETDASGFPR